MSFELFLSAGTLLMIAVMLFAGETYKIPIWKRIFLAIVLTGAGVAGAKLMAFIESGSFSGRSFFGALFFAPIIMAPVAKLMKVSISDTLDICAPAECIMLTFLKIDCTIEGCCRGMLLRMAENGEEIRFPSQVTECVNALLLMLALLWILQRGKQKGAIYLWYMVLYGISRFILNSFRETEPFVWILPAGHFWSIISIGIGLYGFVLWKDYWKKKNKAQK